jgi:putative membrane protein
MLVRLLIRLVILALIIALVARIVPGIHVHGGFLWWVWIALIFSVVNLILGPIFHLLSLPLIILTLGLFLLIVNAALLAITRPASPATSTSTISAPPCSADCSSRSSAGWRRCCYPPA